MLLKEIHSDQVILCFKLSNGSSSILEKKAKILLCVSTNCCNNNATYQ